MRKLLLLLGVFALVLPLMFLGCEGDDGSQGPQGIQGPPGPPGPGAAAQPESCGVCHSDIEATHAAMDVATATVTNVDNNASLAVTFTIDVDGVANDSFTLRRAYVHFDNVALDNVLRIQLTTFQRDTLYSTSTNNPVDVGLTESSVGGTYTVTVPTAYVFPNSTYLFQMESATSNERPVVVVTNITSPLRDLVTDTGCASCHGPYPAWQSPLQKAEPFRHYAVGGSKCQICHAQASRSIEIISRNAAGALVTTGSIAYGTNLVEYVHGIHNSHHMPPDGTYFRTTEDVAPDAEDRYSIGYPSDMRNCKVCHETPAQLAAVASAPPSYYLCMSCHNNWDGFVDHHTGAQLIDAAGTGGNSFHRDEPPTSTCGSTLGACHANPARDEAADFHIDLEASDRHYDSFFGGTDVSYDNPDNVSFEITGVTSDGTNVSFTWTAEKLGAAVDPCNDNTADGPVFSDLGAYLAYAKGDDWVNEFVGTSPGQPASARNLFTALSTTCDNNAVATTTGLVIDPDATYADKMLLAIGGKPIDRFVPGNADIFLRVPSPTYAFNMADGSPATARRDAVDTAKCLACHRGTLYQHGGDRVDNEQLCVICHDPSSGDKNNRLDRYQIVNLSAPTTVNTNATYDGLSNQTYDMRYMIHSIHGIDKRQTPWVIYRSRGIYAFVTPDTIPPTGWPLVNGEPEPSSPSTTPIYGSTNASTQTHNWTIVHYPKAPSECTACHNSGAYEAPDQTKAVALTVDPGGPDYADQSDDIVIGPTAASCTACHYTAPVLSHATQFGYATNVTKEEMLDLATP